MAAGLDDVRLSAAMLARLDALLAGQRGSASRTTGAQSYIWTARAAVADDRALTATLATTPRAGERWVIGRVMFFGIAVVNPVQAYSPIAGVFVVPQGADEESLGDGQSLTGFNVASRGVPLPIADPKVTFIASSATWAYAITASMVSSLILTPGQTLRGVLSCNPGTAAPGPGADSWGILVAMGEIERAAP